MRRTMVAIVVVAIASTVIAGPNPKDVWGGPNPGIGPGEFDTPYGVTVDAAGNVYVADHKNKRIQKFDGSGHYLKETNSDLNGFPWDVTIGSDGYLYATNYYDPNESQAGSLVKLNRDTLEVLTSWTGPSADPIWTAAGLAVDSSGIAYIMESDKNRVRVLDTNTGTSYTWSTGYHAYGLELDPSGQFLYIPAYSGQYLKKWPKGGGTSDVVVPTFPGDPEHVTVDSLGNIYVTSHEFFVWKYSPDGKYVLATFGKEQLGSLPGQFNRATGIGVNSATGDVYIADEFNHRIQVFPEPTSLMLLGVGGLALIRRRRS